MKHATIPLNGTTLPRLTLRFALTLSSITTFMYESAWKNVSNTGAIFHHAPAEQVAFFRFEAVIAKLNLELREKTVKTVGST